MTNKGPAIAPFPPDVNFGMLGRLRPGGRMITRFDNDRLTRVTGDAPMGRLMRENYWIPFARSEAIAAGAKPQRIRLLGENYVAFRGEDGQVGLLDEHCPHRRASLLLARIEDCSLRCIYHGWRMDRTGRVLEVPSEGSRSSTRPVRSIRQP